MMSQVDSVCQLVDMLVVSVSRYDHTSSSSNNNRGHRQSLTSNDHCLVLSYRPQLMRHLGNRRLATTSTTTFSRSSLDYWIHAMCIIWTICQLSLVNSPSINHCWPPDQPLHSSCTICLEEVCFFHHLPRPQVCLSSYVRLLNYVYSNFFTVLFCSLHDVLSLFSFLLFMSNFSSPSCSILMLHIRLLYAIKNILLTYLLTYSLTQSLTYLLIISVSCSCSLSQSVLIF